MGHNPWPLVTYLQVAVARIPATPLRPAPHLCHFSESPAPVSASPELRGSRPCRKRRPSAREDGGVSAVSSSCGARGGFLPRHDEDLREPLVRRQGSQGSKRVARGSASWLSSHGRGLGNTGDAGGMGSVPGLGRPPWRRKWPPTPVFLPGESHRQRSLVGYSPWGH